MDIKFTAADIKKAKFVDLVKSKKEPFTWTGLMQITMMNGDIKEYKCDYIHEGHKADMKALDKDFIIDYLHSYEPEEIM